MGENIILWQPDEARRQQSRLWHFAEHVRPLSGCAPHDYGALHAWSVSDRATFWSAIWVDCGVIGDRGAEVLRPGTTMLDDRFFPQARLNYAENLLRHDKEDAALIFRGEDGQRHEWSWARLRA